MKLLRHEDKLIGAWILKDNKVIEDNICERINWLVSSYLIKIKTDTTGWCILYQDPEDKRFWELTYLQSELHGGGPPSLINLPNTMVAEKYGDI
ncbi:MAG TPA: Imm27 family immunity protein [Bacteroidales bacterium]|nr:Imm27 family immunity protein [Bacteroidales bacterium]